MQLPDGPKAPAFLQTFKAIFQPLEYLDSLAKRYGDIFTFRSIGFPRSVILSHPQAIQELFTADAKLFESGKANKILQPVLGDYSLILHDGDYHQQQRRLLTPPFHGERMKAYGEIICQITEQVISQWQLDKPFIARSSMQEISLRVILQAVFGLHEGTRYQQLSKLLSATTDVFNSPFSSSLLFLPLLQQDFGSLSPWGQFLRRKQQINKLLNAEIQERRENFDANREDILTLLMLAQDEAGQPMTNQELQDELMTLLFAGHETTASALAWALYWIHYLPEVRDKLLQELEACGNELNPHTVAKLPYLNAICSETLRIYPIALFTFPRITKASIKLMGYEFDPGTVLSTCIYLTHQRADLYPEPKQFKPERFLERQFSPYEYFPFGGSNRRCIGMAFALYEMKLVLATILSRLQLSLVDSCPIQPARRGLTMAPRGGVQMVVTGERPIPSKSLMTQFS
jgi:cytochrome P450